jgi:hypothetical protein
VTVNTFGPTLQNLVYDASMVVIEVHMAPGVKVFELSKELLEETQAQVMKPEEARAVGFDGLPPTPTDRAVFYVAVAQRDHRWILNALEADPNVSKYQMHEVG